MSQARGVAGILTKGGQKYSKEGGLSSIIRERNIVCLDQAALSFTGLLGTCYCTIGVVSASGLFKTPTASHRQIIKFIFLHIGFLFRVGPVFHAPILYIITEAHI